MLRSLWQVRDETRHNLEAIQEGLASFDQADVLKGKELPANLKPTLI
ncbi:MAG: hypothetical protein HC848_08470 [Limnobacter sp.]|nr:hypothetical protein [Limnobacter sp.]